MAHVGTAANLEARWVKRTLMVLCWRFKCFLNRRTIFISVLHLLSISYGSISWITGWVDEFGYISAPPLPPSASSGCPGAQQVWPIILAPQKQAEASSELQECVGGQL